MIENAFIEIWGDKAQFARAIGQRATTVRHWFRRGHIPDWHFAAIIDAASRAGVDLTPADLFELRQHMARERTAAE